MCFSHSPISSVTVSLTQQSTGTRAGRSFSSSFATGRSRSSSAPRSAVASQQRLARQGTCSLPLQGPSRPAQRLARPGLDQRCGIDRHEPPPWLSASPRRVAESSRSTVITGAYLYFDSLTMFVAPTFDWMQRAGCEASDWEERVGQGFAGQNLPAVRSQRQWISISRGDRQGRARRSWP